MEMIFREKSQKQGTKISRVKEQGGHRDKGEKVRGKCEKFKKL